MSQQTEAAAQPRRRRPCQPADEPPLPSGKEQYRRPSQAQKGTRPPPPAPQAPSRRPENQPISRSANEDKHRPRDRHNSQSSRQCYHLHLPPAAPKAPDRPAPS